ncbi:MAG: tRNA threonylcarbamoyladenosine biosynthesis protein RimN [Gammaproteobacteria bacterium]|nr:MAG: tRNA threonylcarbamoyladenosine biosynthesis protein RimN [Gammaproteobacteria bacterium]
MSAWSLKLAVQSIVSGGVVAYPTESVFGLGCDPFNPYAVDRLLQLKSRSASKGLILIVNEYAQIETWCSHLDDLQRARIKKKYTHSKTWVIPDADHKMPPWIRGCFNSFAVRIVDHPIAAELCRQVGGPIVSTSANLSGWNPARNTLHVRKQFGLGLDYIVSGSVGGQRAPSEICDVVSGRVFRSG